MAMNEVNVIEDIHKFNIPIGKWLYLN